MLKLPLQGNTKNKQFVVINLLCGIERSVIKLNYLRVIFSRLVALCAKYLIVLVRCNLFIESYSFLVRSSGQFCVYFV